MAASPDQIWAILADFAAISSWAPNVDHSCLLSEENTGLGTTRRIQTARITVTEQVTRWEPGLSLAYTIKGLPKIQSVSNEWQLEAVGESTLVTLTTQIDPGPKPAQKLIAKALARKLAGASKQMLSGLAKEAKPA